MLGLVLKIIHMFSYPTQHSIAFIAFIVMVWGTYNKYQNTTFIHMYIPIFLMEIDINEEELSLKIFMRAEEGGYDIHNTDYYSGIILQINK